MPNSKIDIFTSKIEQQYIEIKFKMCRLYLTDYILSEGLLSGKRSIQAEKLFPKGSGLGLGIIKQLTELNRDSFTFYRVNDEIIKDNSYEYGNNIFVIKILKDEFYE